MTTLYPIVLSTTEPNNPVGMIKVRKYDAGTQTFDVTITENGKLKDFTGLTPFFCVKSSPKTGLGISEQIVTDVVDAKNGRLKYTLTDYDMQHPQTNHAYFAFKKLKDDETFDLQFTTKDFRYTTIASIFDPGIHDSNYIWTFEEILRIFREWIEISKEEFDNWNAESKAEILKIIEEFESWIINNQADFDKWLEDNKEYWNNWLESCRDILEDIDPGGEILTELIDSRTDLDGKTYPKLVERLNGQIGKSNDFREWDQSLIDKMKNEFSERGINIKWFGAVGDGVSDDTDEVEQAINYNDLMGTSKYIYVPKGKFVISRPLYLTSSIVMDGQFVFVGEGQLIFSKIGLKNNELNLSINDEMIAHSIVKIQESHITIDSLTISTPKYFENPLFTAIEVKGKDTENLIWDINLNKFYISICHTAIRITGVINTTTISIKNGTIRNFSGFGIYLDDNFANGTCDYNVIDNVTFQNARLENTKKVCIHEEGLGNSINNIKIFNDGVLYGKLISIESTNRKLEELITENNGIKLTKFLFNRATTTISNVRSEGEPNLGLMRNLYDISNFVVYQADGTTNYGDFYFNYPYANNSYSKYPQLKNLTLTNSKQDGSLVIAKEDNYYKLQNKVEGNKIVFQYKLPYDLVEKINKSKQIMVFTISNFKINNPSDTWLTLSKSEGDPTAVFPINQSVNAHKSGKLVCLTANTENYTIPQGAVINLASHNSKVDQTYELNLMAVYDSFVSIPEDIMKYF